MAEPVRATMRAARAVAILKNRERVETKWLLSMSMIKPTQRALPDVGERGAPTDHKLSGSSNERNRALPV